MDSYRRLSKCIGIFSLLLMVAWLGGCSNKKDLKDIQDPFYEQWRVKAEEAKGNSPVEPPPIDEKPFEIVSQDPAAKAALEVPRPLPNRKISMKMNNDSARRLIHLNRPGAIRISSCARVPRPVSSGADSPAARRSD